MRVIKLCCARRLFVGYSADLFKHCDPMIYKKAQAMMSRQKAARLGIIAAVSLFVALPQAATARVGESLSECESRYGKHSEQQFVGPFKTRSYFKQGYLIIVMFSPSSSGAEHAQGVQYSKPGSFMNDSLSAGEVENFLQSNAGSETWNRVHGMRMAFGAEGLEQRDMIKDAVKNERWIRSDGAFSAVFSKFDNTLLIYSDAMSEYFNRQTEKDMSGF